jgi:hypothetical protein
MAKELSSKQKEFLRYKTRINDSVKKILLLLDKADRSVLFENYPPEIKTEIQDILYSLSSIASIVGGRKTFIVAKGLLRLQQDLRDIEFMKEPLSSHRVFLEDWLGYANTVYAEFNEAGRPVKVKFEVGALGARIKGLVNKR